MNSVNITLEDLTSAATSIDANRTTINDAVAGINRGISHVSTKVWQSDAATTFYSKFNNFMKVFSDCDKAIQNYVKFLNDTVELYKEADAAIKNAANGQ